MGGVSHLFEPAIELGKVGIDYVQVAQNLDTDPFTLPQNVQHGRNKRQGVENLGVDGGHVMGSKLQDPCLDLLEVIARPVQGGQGQARRIAAHVLSDRALAVAAGKGHELRQFLILAAVQFDVLLEGSADRRACAVGAGHQFFGSVNGERNQVFAAVDTVGQRLLAAQGAVGPPAWQVITDRLGPDRIKHFGHMPEHAAATRQAALECAAVDAVVSVPFAVFIQGNRLLVGFAAGRAQAPVQGIAGQLNLIDAPAPHDEVAFGMPVHIAIKTVGLRLQPGQRDHSFIFITGETLCRPPSLGDRGKVQAGGAAGQMAQLTLAGGSAGVDRQDEAARQNVHGAVDQRQQHRLDLGQAMADVPAQERSSGQVGTGPGVIQRDDRTHERHQPQGDFQVVEDQPGAQRILLQQQGRVGA